MITVPNMILKMALLVPWAQNTAVKAKPRLTVRGWNIYLLVNIDSKQILLKTDHIGFYELTRQNYSHDDLPGLEANLIITQGTLYNAQCWQQKTKWHWSSVQRSIFLFAKDLLKSLQFLQIVTAVGKVNMSIGVSNYLQKKFNLNFWTLQFFLGSCYELHHEHQTFTSAQSACQDAGGNLISIIDRYVIISKFGP